MQRLREKNVGNENRCHIGNDQKPVSVGLSMDWADRSRSDSRELAINDYELAQQDFIHSHVGLEQTVEAIARALHRKRQHHVFLTGARGIGKNTAVCELATRLMEDRYPSLHRNRVVSVDCANVILEETRSFLEATLCSFRGASDAILCLRECGAVLRGRYGASNKLLLQAWLQQSAVRVIATMSPWEYNELVTGDAAMRQIFAHVECPEPAPAATLAIAGRHAARLADEFRIEIPQDVVARTVDLCSMFMLHQAHPAKAIWLLQLACEDVNYDRDQLGRSQDVLTIDSIARRLSLETGIPEQTILGRDGDADFESALADAVTGQDQAVAIVARELQLIKAGLSDPGKPASVLMFAGMTGVGKTELAKRVAELYSGSRRLKVYSMGSFTEPHSVSGIMGVPPGYVGYEEGGRLINELNADPFSVFLLDEAEKCHPNIWKPFLNLFDEGWISDHRGVKAYAERAIFILTTNAGDRAIQQLAESESADADIAEKVRSALSRVRNERSSQPVFPPQFLARIKQIIVFRPLDEAAMLGIAERACRRVATHWRQKRGIELVIERPVMELIASKAISRHRQSSGGEGGRVVRKLISELVEAAIQERAIANSDAYQNARIIRARLKALAADAESTHASCLEICFQPLESQDALEGPSLAAKSA
jgi:ATP-dependent Clp protease ATP-binding subunit ClpA